MRKFNTVWIWLLPILFLLTSCSGKQEEPFLSHEEPNHYEVEFICSVEDVFQGTQGTWIAGTSRFFYGTRDNEVELWQYDLEKSILTKTILSMEDLSFVKGNEIGFTNADEAQRILCKSMQNSENEGSFYFCNYDSEGILQNKRNVTKTINSISQKYPYITSRIELPDGKMIAYCEDDKQQNYILVISETGEIKKSIKLGTCSPSDWIMIDNDKLMLITGNQSSLANSLFELDLKKCECRLLVRNLPGSENAIFCDFVKGKNTHNLYYQTEDTVWKYNFEQNEVSKELSFLDVSLDGKYINAMMQEEDESWRALLYDQENGTFNFIRLRKTGEKAAKDSRVELIYAVIGSKQLHVSDANLFNSSQNKAKVTIKEYEKVDQLLADLIAGKTVDIVNLGNEGLYYTLESKGMLEDLRQYLLQDPNLSESDFLPPALGIYANNGKLYSIPDIVSLHVMMCDTVRLQSRESWDFTGFKDFLEGLSDREKALRGSSNQDILINLCTQYMDHFIDRKENRCIFTTEEFYDFLEIASLFPDFDGSEDSWNAIMKGFEDGENILTCVNIGDFESYKYYRSMFIGKGKIMGYPTNDGIGVGIQNGSYTAPAILTGGQHKEEAWEYIKSILIKNPELLHMPVFVTYLPSLNKIMEGLEEKAQSKESLEMNPPPVTSSEIKMIRDLLEDAEPIQSENADIYEIISEEAGAYFAGQKSAEATAEVIQNRVTLYLNEK